MNCWPTGYATGCLLSLYILYVDLVLERDFIPSYISFFMIFLTERRMVSFCVYLTVLLHIEVNVSPPTLETTTYVMCSFNVNQYLQGILYVG